MSEANNGGVFRSEMPFRRTNENRRLCCEVGSGGDGEAAGLGGRHGETQMGVTSGARNSPAPTAPISLQPPCIRPQHQPEPKHSRCVFAS